MNRNRRAAREQLLQTLSTSKVSTDFWLHEVRVRLTGPWGCRSRLTDREQDAALERTLETQKVFADTLKHLLEE